jgi:simple sugar transport system ATP-binding protein
VHALQDVSLDIRAGERLAIIGENGAGKSTLMNVLYGLYRPDLGDVTVEGKVVRLKSPKDALARGVGMVHQHFMLVPSLSVAENVVLGREPTRAGLFSGASANAQVAMTAAKFGFGLDPAARVGDLSVGSQQKVEIVKALHRGANVLILDEPTAVLTPAEKDELFRVLRTLADSGHTVIFIGHKLEEVLGFADRIVVMRRGRLVADVRAKDTNIPDLAALMVGESREKGVAEAIPGGPSADTAKPPTSAGPATGGAFVAENLHARSRRGTPALRGVSLRVHSGELVGIAGVDGNGQTELAEVLSGLRPLDEGRLDFFGQALAHLTPAGAHALGVAHIPEDRHARAMVGAMTVAENLSLGRQRQSPFARGPWIDQAGRLAKAQLLVKDFDVRPPDPELPMGALSGGNQQKVVLARELWVTPRLLVAVQPTRGLDLNAVAAIHGRLLQAKAAGSAVLLVSLDLDEVLTLSDRLYVLASGRVTLELTRAEFDERRIGLAMLGQAQAQTQEGTARA